MSSSPISFTERPLQPLPISSCSQIHQVVSPSINHLQRARNGATPISRARSHAHLLQVQTIRCSRWLGFKALREITQPQPAMKSVVRPRRQAGLVLKSQTRRIVCRQRREAGLVRLATSNLKRTFFLKWLSIDNKT